jgi:hypothetical protein
VAFVPLDGGRRHVEGAVSAIPPEDMPVDEREFWHNYAARAIEQGTLTLQTVAAFRLLCELDAEKRATKAQIDKDGRTYIKCVVDGAGNEHQELKAHPLKSDYAKLAKDVVSLMARFKLAPFGKAESALPGRKTPAANPWAKVVNT